MGARSSGGSSPRTCRRAASSIEKYYDERGYLQCFLRWGANDGPDDAFENFNRWPELHALGADDEILQLYLTGREGMIRQYSEAKTTETFRPAATGCTCKEFSAQSDWMHHGEGLQLFNRMALSAPDAAGLSRARAALRRRSTWARIRTRRTTTRSES